jgi:GNAT superfamily N-acetyltransferase
MRNEPPLSIRPAGREELRNILGLYRELAVGGEEALPLSEAEEIFDRISSYPDYKIYIALNGGEIVGTFALAIMDNLAHLGARSGLIEDVVVKRECQGRGIGKQMMVYALDRCREAGCYKAALSSNMRRMDAHRFYESLGFEKHGYSFQIDLK